MSQNQKEMLLVSLLTSAISLGLVYWAARAGAHSACAPARGNKLRKR